MKTNFVLFLIIIINCFATCNAQTPPANTPLKDTVYTYKTASTDGIGKYYFGREIAHVMGASGSEWLERDDRDQEENTTLAISKIAVLPNAVIADIGAGTGYYSFRLAAKVPAGKVYAVELQDEMIALLKNKKTQLKDSVVDIVKGTEQSPNLPDNSVDLAIMVDVYHELEYPHEVLQALKKALKPNGKILLLEYRGEDPNVPIKALHKTTVTQINKELLANGFTLKEDGEFLPIQHFLLYQKQ